MDVELRERKWCVVLGIEKVDVEGCWNFSTIVNGLIKIIWTFIMEKKHALKKHTLEVNHVMRARKKTCINML